MNMLILDSLDDNSISIKDPKAKHILKVLHKKEGDFVSAGIAGTNSIGNILIERITDKDIVFKYEETAKADNLYPISLILGFPRPIQANRILKDLTSLGVSKIIMTGTELGEKSYMESDFFQKNEYKAALLEGATQAGNPLLPQIETFWSLKRCLESIKNQNENRWALHPYNAECSIGKIEAPCNLGFIIAIGSERGWTQTELEMLKNANFHFASIGKRILKTETAANAAVSVFLSKLNLI